MNEATSGSLLYGWVAEPGGDQRWIPLDMPAGEFKQRLWRWANTASTRASVLGVLAGFCNMRDGGCFPSHAALFGAWSGHMTALEGRPVPCPSRATQTRWLKALGDMGAFEVEQRRGRKNTYGSHAPAMFTSKVYRLNIGRDLSTGGLHDFLAPLPPLVSTGMSPGTETDTSDRTGTSTVYYRSSIKVADDARPKATAKASIAGADGQPERSSSSPGSADSTDTTTSPPPAAGAVDEDDSAPTTERARFGARWAEAWAIQVPQQWPDAPPVDQEVAARKFATLFDSHGPELVEEATRAWFWENRGRTDLRSPFAYFFTIADDWIDRYSAEDQDGSSEFRQDTAVLLSRYNQRATASDRPEARPIEETVLRSFWASQRAREVPTNHLLRALDAVWNGWTAPGQPPTTGTVEVLVAGLSKLNLADPGEVTALEARSAAYVAAHASTEHALDVIREGLDPPDFHWPGPKPQDLAAALTRRFVDGWSVDEFNHALDDFVASQTPGAAIQQTVDRLHDAVAKPPSTEAIRFPRATNHKTARP